ncbi:hypothetical protein [Flavobacterium sp. HNIBRBA15423]|uniref:hypothetical protein n=1 Tax=Flavobacterium sp. HNIBRBA15423 TaxID=3458683 RepID=UPI0040441998
MKVEKHIKAYEYLSKIEPYKDSGIYVVDTLYYIPRVFAYSYLLKNKNQKEKSKILDSLWRLDQNLSYDEKYFKISKYLNNNNKAKYNLYFDEQTDNKLNVEIFHNHNNVKSIHYHISMFGNSEIYSFTFNGNNEIIDVKKETAINN